jgi:hypothetical protein
MESGVNEDITKIAGNAFLSVASAAGHRAKCATFRFTISKEETA